MDLLRTVTAESGATAEAVGDEIAAALAVAKVVHVRRAEGAEETTYGSFYESAARSVADALEPGHGASWGTRPREQWIEVKADSSRADRDRKRPLHTDEAAVEDPAQVMVMYCERAATRGAGNVFLDGEDLVAYLERTDGDLLARLRDQPIMFSRKGESRTTVVIRSRSGVPSFTWDEGAVANDDASPTGEVAARFRNVLESPKVAEHVQPIDLGEGDAIFWWDDLVLHGRAPAEVGGEHRHFRKTGIAVTRVGTGVTSDRV
jgi:alpha-ketoglutarate-dependent taurine dioxygenase